MTWWGRRALNMCLPARWRTGTVVLVHLNGRREVVRGIATLDYVPLKAEIPDDLTLYVPEVYGYTIALFDRRRRELRKMDLVLPPPTLADVVFG